MDDIRRRIPESPVRLLDKLRLHIRQSGLAYRTEQTYIHWVKRFIYFHGKKHPKDMGCAEIERFLTQLAVSRHCASNTQRVALNALIYLYKRFFGADLEELQFSMARVHRRLPVVYSREEIAAILSHLRGGHKLMVGLLYGSGLRSAELLSLRV